MNEGFGVFIIVRGGKDQRATVASRQIDPLRPAILISGSGRV